MLQYAALLLTILSSAFCAVSCRTSSNTESQGAWASYAFEPGFIEALHCKEGRPHYLMLEDAHGPTPGYTELRVPPFDNPRDIPGVAVATPDQKIRLDLCLRDHIVELNKVVYFHEGEFKAIPKSEGATMEGLDELFYKGETLTLNIELPYAASSKLVIRGHRAHRQAYFALLRWVDGKEMLDSPREPIRIGAFVPSTDGGTSQDACARTHGVRRWSHFAIDTADFSVLSCRAEAPSEESEPLRVRVRDRSKRLEASIRGELLDIPKDQWIYEPGAFEALTIDAPHARYEIRAGEHGLSYSFEYGKGARKVKESGQVPRAHLF